MNCDAARRRLLAEEHPDQPTDDDVRRHLAACASCRAWGRRLTLIERQIAFLPVPASSARSAFVRRFLRTGGPVVLHVPLSRRTPVKERGLQKLSLAVAIAAVLAVFTLGWWSWPRVPTPTPRPVPLWIVQIHNERDGIRGLAEPRERVERLTTLTEKLRGQARALTRDGDAEDLGRLAKEYRELIGGDLMEHARALPAAQREIVLGGARQKLIDAESEFRRAAGDASLAGASTAGPLQQLADAARDGQKDLQALLPAA